MSKSQKDLKAKEITTWCMAHGQVHYIKNNKIEEKNSWVFWLSSIISLTSSQLIKLMSF